MCRQILIGAAHISFSRHTGLSKLPVGQPEGHLYFSPPGQGLAKCWAEPSRLRGPLGETGGMVLLVGCLIWCCPENEICAALIGIVGASGGFVGLVLPLPKCLVNRDSESDRIFLGEGISFVDRESLSWAKLGHPAGYKLLKVVPAVMWQMGIC